MEKMIIQDESGDKSFFTIIPNYIANHSTANDQALYFQMKKFAGENGNCFATQKTLMKKLSIGKKAFNKSLEYLLEKNWITFIGITEGKTRPIKTYKINNIWILNNEFYKNKQEIGAKRNLSFQEIGAERDIDKSQKKLKIGAERALEEEPVKEEPINNILSENEKNKIINIDHENIIKIFDLFKTINPTINYGHKTNRNAVIELVKQFGIEKTIQFTNFAISIQGQDYAPTITTPWELKEKLAKLKIFADKLKNNKIQSL